MTKKTMPGRSEISLIFALVAIAAIFSKIARLEAETPQAATNAAVQGAGSTTTSNATIELTSNQLNSIVIAPVGIYSFPVETEAVGSIDYVDDLSVQVFPPNQGKLLKTFAEFGDNVQKGQTLYTVDSPDLLQAESTLIGAAATLELTSKELTRAKELFATNVGVSERELEQAINDEQTAEGALKAARDAVRIFGKSEEEINQIVKYRRVDPTLVVPSPIAGQVTFFDAPPGMLVQPGSPPAPFTVSDVSVKWMLANVIESETPLYKAGLPLKVTVMAYPNRVFEGKIAKVYPNVDPNTHRLTVRCEIPDPQNELRPGMLANFVIVVQAPVEAMAIPVNGVVRNGDGTYSAWITTDRHHFLQAIVKIGLQKDGRYQVLDGLQPGQLAVTDGAIFLNNILEAPPSD